MKYLNPTIMILAAITAVALSGCGKTKRTSSTGTSQGVVVNPAPTVNNEPTVVVPPVTPPTPGPGGAPLSYEFKLKGNQAAATGQINTDGVLKVKFRVTADQGNNVHQATELSVKIAVGGTEVTPTFTNNNYTYGQVGETSNVIDLSQYITQGQPVTIVVKSPKNDFYCTYRPNPFYYWDSGTGSYQPTNPYFNNYPGCRKPVFVNTTNPSLSHDWGGVLIVQTSSTNAI